MDTGGEDAAGKLLPRPHKAAIMPDVFTPGEECVILCGAPEPCFAGKRLAAMIEKEWSVRLPVRTEHSEGGCFLLVGGSPERLLESCADMPEAAGFADEEYLLRVGRDGAFIKSRTPRALLWGAMTLRQLAAPHDTAGFSLQGAEIHDRPRYGLRGFMIDSGRAPNSIQKIKRIIRICSTFKLNSLLFREGDDEMNAVRYKSNRLGSLNPFALTVEELSELSDYTLKHGIDVSPIVWSDAPETPDEYRDSVYRCLWSYADGGKIDFENEHLARSGQEEAFRVLSQRDRNERALMAGGSGSGHTPYSKSPCEAA